MTRSNDPPKLHTVVIETDQHYWLYLPGDPVALDASNIREARCIGLAAGVRTRQCDIYKKRVAWPVTVGEKVIYRQDEVET